MVKEQNTSPTVKRPYPRTAPCSIMCRADGNQIAAMIGTNPHEGVWGFGETLPDALRDLALQIENETDDDS